MSKAKKSDDSQFKFKSVRKLTGIQFLVLETHKPVFVTITSLITRGVLKKKPASSVTVTNVETGEIQKLLLGRVLERQLLENYGEEGFLNKTFRIERGEKVKGNENEYYEFEIEEIEVE